MSTTDQLNAQLDKLASFDAGPFPILSLYLDLRPDQRGRDHFEPFLRKELADRVSTYPARSPERDSLERDVDRIVAVVQDVDRSLNGLALFSSAATDLFETIPMAVAPFDGHRLYVSNQPHLYPLARILDQYPRYAAIVADTNRARIFVFAVNAIERADTIEGVKTRRHKMGGWSQARYQRHVDNFHLQHAKEVVDTLGRIVRDEKIDKVVIAGDDVIVPLLRDQMSKEVADRIVDVIKLDIRTSEREILEKTIAALREKDVEGDREYVDALVGAYRAGGLACAGVEATKKAFELGQVDELVVPGSPDAIRVRGAKSNETSGAERTKAEQTADELVALARQTSAGIRFIEDAMLLEPLGGVGAFLRFKL